MFREIYDISVTLGRRAVTYPGDQPFRRQLTCEIGPEQPFELSRLELSAHSGSHLDAPAHFVAGGRRIDDYPAGDFILPAVVIDVAESPMIGPQQLEGIDLEPSSALLFRTQNSRADWCRSGELTADFVSLSPRLADACVAAGLALVGIDHLSVDGGDSTTYPVHRRLLGAGIFILEGIDLAAVSAGRYTLVCLPLKIEGGEAAPVRAILAR